MKFHTTSTLDLSSATDNESLAQALSSTCIQTLKSTGFRLGGWGRPHLLWPEPPGLLAPLQVGLHIVAAMRRCPILGKHIPVLAICGVQHGQGFPLQVVLVLGPVHWALIPEWREGLAIGHDDTQHAGLAGVFPSPHCNVVQFAPGYVRVSECESDDRSCGAMGEEDIETGKSEFRLGMICIVHRVFIYS